MGRQQARTDKTNVQGGRLRRIFEQMHGVQHMR